MQGKQINFQKKRKSSTELEFEMSTFKQAVNSKSKQSFTVN